jgi:hypothetical protein
VRGRDSQRLCGGWFLFKESNGCSTAATHLLECLHGGQTLRPPLMGNKRSAQHLLWSLPILFTDELETDDEGREKTNFIAALQINTTSFLQQQRDDTIITPEASKIGKYLHPERGDEIKSQQQTSYVSSRL